MSDDRVVRDRIGRWLEGLRMEVLECPGPSAPEYRCLGGEGRPCPLVGAADLVVLDSGVQSDVVMEGTSSMDLFAYYLGSDLPIVVLDDGSGGPRRFVEQGVVSLDRPPSREEFLRAVAFLLTAEDLGDDRS